MDPTSAHPSNDKTRLYVETPPNRQEGGPYAVKLTNFRLVDELLQEYHPIPKVQVIPTIGGTVGLGPGTYFWPSGIVIVEPNKPLEIAAVLATEKPDWARISKRMSYTLTLGDDHGRSVGVPFTCSLQYFEMI